LLLACEVKSLLRFVSLVCYITWCIYSCIAFVNITLYSINKFSQVLSSLSLSLRNPRNPNLNSLQTFTQFCCVHSIFTPLFYHIMLIWRRSLRPEARSIDQHLAWRSYNQSIHIILFETCLTLRVCSVFGSHESLRKESLWMESTQI
jgi:hypothetical protein